MKLKKGDLVEIKNNSILNGAMGLPVATGEVFMIFKDGNFAFKCRETGAMERCELGDGEIEIKESA